MPRPKDQTEIEWAVRAICDELAKIGWGDAARPAEAKWGAIEKHAIKTGDYANMIDNTLERIATALEGIQETLGGVDVLLSSVIGSKGRS